MRPLFLRAVGRGRIADGITMDRDAEYMVHRARLKPSLAGGQVSATVRGWRFWLSLTVALYIPYLWMDKLTEKIALDAGPRGLRHDFRAPFPGAANNPKGLPILGDMRLIPGPQPDDGRLDPAGQAGNAPADESGVPGTAEH